MVGGETEIRYSGQEMRIDGNKTDKWVTRYWNTGPLCTDDDRELISPNVVKRIRLRTARSVLASAGLHQISKDPQFAVISISREVTIGNWDVGSGVALACLPLQGREALCILVSLIERTTLAGRSGWRENKHHGGFTLWPARANYEFSHQS